MAIPGNNSINVIEATPELCNILGKLKRNQPFGNEASSTKNKGMNGGISFNTDNGENAIITGAFDVTIYYPYADNLPYIHVYDSSNPNSGKAGYVYSGSTTWELNSITLTPMIGVIYVDVNYALNTRSISIASSLPTLSSTDRRWVYALATVTQSDGVYAVHRMNMPGNLTVTNRWVS